jgi:hypothetical protein
MDSRRVVMARRPTYWIVTAVVLVALAEAAFSENLPTVRTTSFAASVPAQARIEVDAAGQIVSVFNTTDGIGVQPSILNVYQDGVKIMVTPQITQELDSICSKIDWRCGGVVYQRKEDASLSDAPGSAIADPCPQSVIRYQRFAVPQPLGNGDIKLA